MSFGLRITNIVLALGVVTLSACSTEDRKVAPAPAPAPAPAAPAKAEAKAAEAKAPEKAKATKLAGDVGLLDTEKNYLIIVTKEGKLVTVEFDPKFQPTQRTFENSKIADIGLGSSGHGDLHQAGREEYRDRGRVPAGEGRMI